MCGWRGYKTRMSGEKEYERKRKNQLAYEGKKDETRGTHRCYCNLAFWSMGHVRGWAHVGWVYGKCAYMCLCGGCICVCISVDVSVQIGSSVLGVFAAR